MALPPAKVYKQDMPPPGGFPSVRYKKVSPQRGPSGLMIVLGAVAVSSAGLWYAIADNKERDYQNLAKFNQRYERAFVLQAKEDIAWQRRHKELLDEERKLMQHVPGWVVGKNVYFGQDRERPAVNHQDPRRISQW